MADQRDDSPMGPPDNDGPRLTADQLLEQVRDMRKKNTQDNIDHEDRMRRHRAADEKMRARMAKNLQSQCPDWAPGADPRISVLGV